MEVLCKIFIIMIVAFVASGGVASANQGEEKFLMNVN